MSLPEYQFKAVLAFFKLRRNRIVTADNNERDESDLAEACAAIDAASMVIIPKGVIDALHKTISELHGQDVKKPNIFDEGGASA